MIDRTTGLILAIAVLVAAIGGYAQHRHRQSAPPAASTLVGQPVPDLGLTDLDGKTHQLSDYRGRRVLLNFWATWCVPCVAEMPALAAAQRNVGERGPIVIGIAMDEPARIRVFLAAHPVDYPILVGQLDAPSSSLQLGDTGEILPYSVLVDAEGRAVASHAGPLQPAQLQRWLAPEGQP